MTDAQSVQQIVKSSRDTRNSGAPDEALRLVEDALTKFPGRRELFLQKAMNLNRLGGRYEEEVAAWDTCFDHFKEESKLAWFKMCRTVFEQIYKFSTDPQLLAARTRRIESLHAKAKTYLIDAARAHPDDPQRQKLARETMAWISECTATRLGTSDALDQHLSNFPESKGIEFFRQYALSLFKPSPELGLSKFKDFERTMAARFPITAISENAPRDEVIRVGRFWLEMADVLMHVGQIDAAQSVLERLPEQTPGLVEAEKVCARLRARVPEPVADTPPPPAFDEDDDSSIVTWSPALPTDKVLFVFTGMAQKFYFALPFFHNLLKGMGCHLVYLRDKDGSYFMNGQTGGGPGELEAELRGFQEQVKATRSYALGTSSGGYAALRYGIALNMQGVLSFSIPLVSLEDARLASVQMMYQKLQRNFPEEDFDLVRYCENATSIPPTTIAFSENSARDKAAAERFSHVPQIRLEAARDSRAHPSIKAFLAEGRFFPMIEQMMS